MKNFGSSISLRIESSSSEVHCRLRPRRRRGLLLGGSENLAESLGNDGVVAGLHHPDANDKLAARAGNDFDARLTVAELVGDLRGRELAFFLVPVDVQMWDGVRDRRDLDLGADVFELGERLDNAARAGFPLFPDSLMIALEE